MIIYYCVDVEADFEAYLMKLAGTSEQLTDETVFTLEGSIEGSYLPATFYEEAEYPEPLIEKIKQIDLITVEGNKFTLVPTPEQEKHIMQEYFTDKNYEEMYVKLFEQAESERDDWY